MHSFYLYVFSLIILFPAYLKGQDTKTDKPLLIITTDIGQDPDDQQSMIRLLHYANEFNIVGLIANADGNYDHEPPEIRTDILFELIDAYAKIHPNLRKLDPTYPDALQLKKTVKAGCSGNGRNIPYQDYIGEGKSTEGSNWIIQQVDQAEERVNISIWGGACDLAQALFDVSKTRSPEAVQQFVSKIRVYFIGKQDSSNDWIIDHFPDLWMVLAMSHDGNSWNSAFRGIFLGGDMQSTSLEWLHENLIGQHALGNLYPQKTWTRGGTKNPHGAMKEGDTPSFLFFLKNGLNIASQPDWGGWGGRFEQTENKLFRDVKDSVYDISENTMVRNAKATVFRWRDDIQNDLAARVQWGRGLGKSLNYYPLVQINGDQSIRPLYIKARPATTLTVDASLSIDPDGDSLSFEWMIYPEASTFPKAEGIPSKGFRSPKLSLELPLNGNGTIHLILKVTDHAEYPLVSYKRVIIEFAEEEKVPLILFDTDMGSDCDDVGALAMLHHYIDQGKATLLACVYSSGKVPFGAGIIDAINTHFDRPEIPIGAAQDSTFGDPQDKMDAGKLARDTAAYGHDLIFNSDVPDQTLLSRKILAKQADHSVTYLTIGHTKALYDLLQSKADSISDLTGMELIRQKVKKWVALGGLNANQSTEFGSKDWNFFRNGTSRYTDYLLEHFPRPVYLINAGSDVLTGQSLIHADAGSIVRTAYRDWLWKVEKKSLLDGRPSWDLAAVFFAVEGSGEFLEIPEKGELHFDLQNGSIWEKNGGENHFYVNQKAGIEKAFGDYLNSLLYKN